MAQIHYFICDICEHHEAVAIKYHRGMGYEHYPRPESWITIEQYEVCSQECAKRAVDKVKKLPTETVHCKCRGCK